MTTSLEKIVQKESSSAAALAKVIEFAADKYLQCELNHINHLYESRPPRYSQYTRSQFVDKVYIPSGLAENFKQYWFGERHLVRSVHWGEADIAQHERGN